MNMDFRRFLQAITFLCAFQLATGVFALEAQTHESTHSSGFVGKEACGQCHKSQLDLWQGSHHELSMQHATGKTILGDFNNRKYSYNGITSTFYKRGNGFFVRTDGPDGKLADYQIKYTLGYFPLQQYLIEFPDGRLQALGLAWDSRPKSQGGQHWYHLYPKEKVKAGDKIHWTGIDQNWNHMCSECHSTNLHKNYDAEKNTFSTSWTDMNVGCESCHGPRSEHVSWAELPASTRGPDNKLAIKLSSANRMHWQRSAPDLVAHPEKSDRTNNEIDLCSRCHSRRSETSENYEYGKSLVNTHEPQLLTSGMYYADGRMQDEVFNYGSYRQSKMFKSGVTCSDCHEPHSLKLRHEGNGVCTQCHNKDTYETEKHHFHKSGSKGSLCADCHMPASNYMVVDRRHDHGFRIPRPDLTEKLGIPNACNDCHIQKGPKWALDSIVKHFGHAPLGYQNYAHIFHDARNGLASAWTTLVELANTKSAPAIARATALWELRNFMSRDAVSALSDAITDPDPLVRLGATKSVSEGPMPYRSLLLSALDDPMLTIRTQAASGLSATPPDSLTSAQRESLSKASNEYISSQLLNGDRPEAHMNLGVFYAESGHYAKAEDAYRTALKLDPRFTQAYVNLADLMRLQNREPDSRRILEEALKALPNQPDLHLSLGLQFARTGQMKDALVALERSYDLGKRNPQYGYVYAVALKDLGDTQRAINILDRLHHDFPNDVDILTVLVSYSQELGGADAASRYAKLLIALRPKDEGALKILK